ncbi:MAG: hypothetical protein KQI81_08900 [Deltaproteobacteria bacterium]|nr:hypothetical protein [Deltaproteobacteria bacterium]
MNIRGSWPYIQVVAKSRLAHNKTPRHISKYGDSLEIIGAAGEIVARRFLGLNEKLHTGFDNGIDFYYAGKKIDVKATMLTPKVDFRNLQWPIYKIIKADIIILTAIDTIRKIGVVLGYATKDDILSAYVNLERETPCYEVPVESLKPAWRLIARELGRKS